MPYDPEAIREITRRAEESVRRANGHTQQPEPPPQEVSTPQLPVSYHDWRYKVGMVVKKTLDDVPVKDRPMIASMKPERLIDLIVKQAHDIVDAREAPWWPLPEGLSESEVDEELHALAGKAIEVFRNAYPAPVEYHLPSAGEIDRSPIDAYDAYTAMHADKREYSWNGLVREGCTMILSALMGSGKTTLSMNVTRGWALGEPVLDRACKPSNTLVVVSPKEWDAWADTIGFWGIKGKVFLISSLNVQFGNGPEQAEWFAHTMAELKCQTFVLDTLFDFFGIPPHNTGDANRMAMAEQVPLLEVVRMNGWSGIVTGHPPKSEAQAVVPRDPEESFGGHTAWSAQHRMRAVIYRKAKGASTFKTARGGYGDTGITEEHMLLFNEATRLVSLGGKFANYLGEIAMPVVVEALQAGGWHGRSDLIRDTGKGKNFVYAGVKFGLKAGTIKWNQRGGRSAKYALPDEPDEQEQMGLL